MVRRGRESRRFMSCTTSTGSRSTNSVFGHDSGASKVEENATLGIAVNAAKPGSSGISAANPDISRYVVAPIRSGVLDSAVFLEPGEILGPFHAPQAGPAVGGPVTIE